MKAANDNLDAGWWINIGSVEKQFNKIESEETSDTNAFEIADA